MLFLLFCVSLVLFIAFLRKSYIYWTERCVFQDLAVPLLGINWEIFIHQTSETEIFEYLYGKYSDQRFIGVYDFLTPVLIIKDPDLVYSILVKNFEYFINHKPAIPSNLDPLWNKNLVNLKGEKWKNMRSALSPTFTNKKMRHMFILMKECATNFVQHIQQKEKNLLELEVREAFSKYINDVIVTTCFSYQCDSMSNADNEFYLRGMKECYNMGFWRHTKITLVRGVPCMSKIIKVTKFGEEVTNFFKKVMNDNVDYRKKNNIRRLDMISLLMESGHKTSDSDKKEIFGESNSSIDEIDIDNEMRMDISLDDITANAMGFFFAGFSTTTSLLCFMCYELSVNPDIQKKLLNEIDNFKKQGKELNFDDLSEFTYLQMTISETLRKYPPFCRADRQCTKLFSIQPQRNSEKLLTIEPGISVWIPIYSLHHDEKYWPHPEKFQPERFSPANKKNIKPGTYLPFGMGPRVCIGYRFVLQKVKILFYEILSRFEIVPVERTVIPCKLSKHTSHIVPGSGFWFGFRRRHIQIDERV